MSATILAPDGGQLNIALGSTLDAADLQPLGDHTLASNSPLVSVFPACASPTLDPGPNKMAPTMEVK